MKRHLLIIISIFIFEILGISFSKLSFANNEKLNEAVSNLEMYKYLKKYDKALEACAEIYKINHLFGELDYADVYRMMGNYQESIKWAKIATENARKQGASTEGALLIMSSSYALMGDEDASNQILDQIIKEHPNAPLAYKFYAEYYEQIGDKKNAIKYWQEALKRFTDARAIEQAKERIATLEKSK